jgi:hypothetical protein
MHYTGRIVKISVNSGSGEIKEAVCLETAIGFLKLRFPGASMFEEPCLEVLVGKHADIEGYILNKQLFANKWSFA